MLNERGSSPETAALASRVGRALGLREGTGPEDDPLLREQRAEARAEGQLAEANAATARELLRSRNLAVSAEFPADLSGADRTALGRRRRPQWRRPPSPPGAWPTSSTDSASPALPDGRRLPARSRPSGRRCRQRTPDLRSASRSDRPRNPGSATWPHHAAAGPQSRAALAAAAPAGPSGSSARTSRHSAVSAASAPPSADPGNGQAAPSSVAAFSRYTVSGRSP